MKIDRELDEILGELRREYRATNAPESIETALRTETKRRGESGAGGLRPVPRPVPRPVLAWAFAIALVAAIVWGGTVVEMRHIHGQRNSVKGAATGQVQTGAVRTPQVPSSTSADSVLSTSPVDVRPPSTHMRRVPVARTRPNAATQSETATNSLQEFVPLPVSEGLPPAAQLSVVRVKLRGSDLQQYGLEAPADAAMRSLLAEFVVGEDGLPRAIRIIQ